MHCSYIHYSKSSDDSITIVVVFLRRLKILKTLPIQVKLDIIISNSVWFKVHGTCSTHNCNKWLWLPYLLISTYASCSQVFLSLPYKYRLTHLLNKNNNHNISLQIAQNNRKYIQCKHTTILLIMKKVIQFSWYFDIHL